MGLGAPKRRNKLSHDPNNTAWSRSTTNFGHRMLSQQGWEPGQYLGAENANHSDHYTAANASHIRILLREDNLGLGAKIGGNKAETFGLSLFSGVLGRLNGKDEGQVQKQQDALRDAELRQYQVGKYGLMNFVSGGLLVGDKIEEPGQKSLLPVKEVKSTATIEESKGKKRKAEEGESGEGKPKDKKQKIRKTKDGDAEGSAEQLSSDVEIHTERSRRKDKKKAKRAVDISENDEASETTRAEKTSKKRREKANSDDTAPTSITADEKARLKQEKRARKEDRRKRKEARRLKKEAKPAKEAAQETQPAVQSSQAVNGGRHAVRHRYIQQKRMAGMNAQAMKEIFMIKAA